MATEYLLPVANGNYATFTAVGAATDWECVDDPVATPDDGATYAQLASSTTPTRESVVLGAFTSGGTINSVTVTVKVDLGAASNGTIALFLRIGGSDYDGSNQTLNKDGGYVNYTAVWTTNPATSAAWAAGDLAAMEAGAIITNPSVLASTRITQIYATVDYIPGQPGQPWPVSVRIGTSVANMEALLLEPHVEFIPGVRKDQALSGQDRWVGAPRCRWTWPDRELTGEQFYQMAKQTNGFASAEVYIDIPTQTLNLETYTPTVVSYRAVLHWPLEDVDRARYNRWTLPDDGLLFTHLEGI